MFQGEERVLLVGMDHFARLCGRCAKHTLPSFPISEGSSFVISVESVRDRRLEIPRRVRVPLLASNLSHCLPE